jgi:predicted ribosomally synthesized peptide with SipW-like signal peptide
VEARLAKAGIAGVGALALLVGGGTMAALSDLAVVPGNEVGVGTLELDLSDAAGGAPTLPFDDTALLPGGPAAVWVKEVRVSGDVPEAHLYASVRDLAGTEDGCVGNTDPTITATTREVDLDPACASPGPGGQLADVAQLRVSAYVPAADRACDARVTDGPYYDRSNPGASYAVGDPRVAGQKRSWGFRTLAGLADGAAQQFTTFDEASQQFSPVVVTPGTRLCVAAALQVPADADNRAAGDTARFDVRLDVVQK